MYAKIQFRAKKRIRFKSLNRLFENKIINYILQQQEWSENFEVLNLNINRDILR